MGRRSVSKVMRVLMGLSVAFASVTLWDSPVHAAVPNAPEIVDIVRDPVAQTFSFFFNPPSGGDPATGYRISGCSTDIDKATTASPIVLTYDEVCAGYGGFASFQTQNPAASVYFELKATNSAGVGAPSAYIEVQPYYISAPRITSVVSTLKGCVVNFDMPSSMPAGVANLGLVVQDEQDSFSANGTQFNLGQTTGSAFIRRAPTGYGPNLVDGKASIKISGSMPNVLNQWGFATEARGIGSAEFECSADSSLSSTPPARPTMTVTPGNGKFTVNWSVTSSGSSPIDQGHISVVQLSDNQGPIPDPFAQTPTNIDVPWIEQNCIDSQNFRTESMCGWLNSGGRFSKSDWTDQYGLNMLTSGSLEVTALYDPQSGQFSVPVVNGRTYVVVLWLTNFDDWYDGVGKSMGAAYAVVNPGVQPTVTSVNPTSGSTAGGASITITGTNFVSGATVTVGGAACTNVVVVNSTEITCATPAGTAGTASVVVTSNGQSNAANTLFTYTAPASPPAFFVPPPEPVSTQPPATQPPASQNPGSPDAPQASSLVNSGNQQTLTQQPGGATALVNGQPVSVDVDAPADLPAARVDPEDRSPQQIQQLQQAANSIVDALGDTNSPIGVQPTATGAVITGLLPQNVPVEDVVLVKTPETATVFAALNGDGSVTEVNPGGVIQILGDGLVGVVGTGLKPGDTVELVIMSTPQLLGRFEVNAKGEIKAQASLPDALGVGNHTLVVASPTVKASLGLKVASTRPTLPVTGGGTEPLGPMMVLLSLGAILVVVSRRRIRLVP
jgi:hypothetical protein